MFHSFSSHSGLGPSSIHQSLPPDYPPSLQGAMPPHYQFARDPQSGQLIVIPAEHLSHYGMNTLSLCVCVCVCVCVPKYECMLLVCQFHCY